MAITPAMITQVSQFYVALFGRAPDGAPISGSTDGLSYWTQELSNGISLPTVANQMFATTEARAYYPGFYTPDQIIHSFYLNVLGRDDAADPVGHNYWVAALNAPGANAGTVIYQMIVATTSYVPGSVSDTAINAAAVVAQNLFNNRATVAEYYGTHQGNVAGATAALSGVTDNIATVATAEYAIDHPAVAGQTFTLTTGVDTSGTTLIGSLGTLSTAGNDTFNGTNLTLNSFDNINGGLGVNTFNYADTTAANFALPPSLTLANLQVVNVSRAATGAGTGAVTITDTTFGTGVTTLNYSEASLAANMTTAAASVTLNSATAVSVVSTGTGVFTTVDITDTSTTPASTGSTLTTATVTKSNSTITLTGNAITTVNLNNDTGATTVTAAAGTRTLTVNTSGTPTHGGLTDATATTLTINNSGVATLGTFTAAKATTVNVSTTAAAIGLVVTAPIATTLNFSGTNTVAAVITGSVALTAINISGSAGLTSVVDLSGIATNLATITSTSTGTTNGTVTLGNANTTEGFGTGVTFTGGAGNDTISVGATTKAINVGAGTNKVYIVSGTAPGTGGSITATAGSTDTLYMTNTDAAALTTTPALGAAFKAAVTGFETFNVGTAGATTVSMTDAGSFSTLAFTTAAVTQTVTGMTTGKTIEATWGAAMTDVAINTLSAPADTMTIKLLGDLSTGARPFGQFSPAGVEALTITTVDSNTTHTDQLATITINDSAASSIILTGNNGVALSAASTAITTFDASGITKGGVTFTSGILPTDVNVHGSLIGNDTLDFKAATAIVTITETAGTNTLLGSATIGSTITGGTGADTITGGAGIDTIVAGAGATGNTITGVGGADSINLTGSTGADIIRYNLVADNASTTGLNVDTITNFATTIDKINILGGGGANATLLGLTIVAGTTTAATMGAVVTDATPVATIGEVYAQLAIDLLNSNNAFAGSTAAGSGMVAREVTFTAGAAAGTYLVINDSSISFQPANDLVIHLVGTTTVVAGDLTFTA